jgi:hypothetical protein
MFTSKFQINDDKQFVYRFCTGKGRIDADYWQGFPNCRVPHKHML